METLVLGWYVMVNTGSVLWLTVFGSLQYVGTLAAPMVGSGRRPGHAVRDARDLRAPGRARDGPGAGGGADARGGGPRRPAPPHRPAGPPPDAPHPPPRKQPPP